VTSPHGDNAGTQAPSAALDSRSLGQGPTRWLCQIEAVIKKIHSMSTVGGTIYHFVVGASWRNASREGLKGRLDGTRLTRAASHRSPLTACAGVKQRR